MDTILMGNCLQIAPSLPDSFIDLIVTSPPYAQQRKKQYGGISELDSFTTQMSSYPYIWQSGHRQ